MLKHQEIDTSVDTKRMNIITASAKGLGQFDHNMSLLSKPLGAVKPLLHVAHRHLFGRQEAIQSMLICIDVYKMIDSWLFNCMI